MFYRSPHNYDWAAASDEAALAVGDYGESLTVQSMAEDADLNVLMRRFGVTGHFPQTTRLPEYGDYTGIRDFRSALEVVKNAQDNFMALDPDLRGRFQNDPQRFLEFVANPNNLPELRRLGLAVTPPDASGGVSDPPPAT